MILVIREVLNLPSLDRYTVHNEYFTGYPKDSLEIHYWDFNTHEVTYKAKVWAMRKYGKSISSTLYSKGHWVATILGDTLFESEIEFDAVLQACEHIRKESE